MKLMRGYRFRREAFTMLRAFLIVFVAAFAVEAVSDWARGRTLIMPVTALALSGMVFLALAAALLVIDMMIRAHEKKHGIQYPARRAAGP